jgi:hypothetical protein
MPTIRQHDPPHAEFSLLIAAEDRTSALDQRVSETHSPSVLGGRVHYLVLPELHLDVRRFLPEGMEGDAVVELRIQIVSLIIPTATSPDRRKAASTGSASLRSTWLECRHPIPWSVSIERPQRMSA